MTNPQGPPGGDPSEGARPPAPGGPPNRPAPPRPAQPSEYETRQIRHPGPPPRRPPQPPGPPPGFPPNPQSAARPRPYEESPTTQLAAPAQPQDAPTTRKRGFFRKKRSIALILGIVVAVVVAAPVGVELYVRNQASGKVGDAVQCEVQDSATVSFATAPPVAWQYLTGHYPDISVQTAGNQIRQAKGMKIGIDIRDIRLNQTTNSAGTIASLNGTITWSSDGIKQSIQSAIPTIGSLVASSVTTNPSDGTVSLKGLLDSATLKPVIANNGVSLQVANLTALGSTMSTESVQKSLDDYTAKATQNYPLGIHADGIKVTDSGIEATFSSTNATIPAGGSQDSCFANV
ncbi:LmeA family phospholipid-binding protein [Mycobacterium shigaense]|uniref:LmeA family phospholipid-binding protein n=1 Tax=Mycobacterium shigaense TaxID=722731 RepID=UPI002AE08CB2|nr:DUF2993 domain-containing protein [Mycobacterium shigaense]MEA1125079.1 DUF2993 domain-containing protein [Mycobacterium shigaense]